MPRMPIATSILSGVSRRAKDNVKCKTISEFRLLGLTVGGLDLPWPELKIPES